MDGDAYLSCGPANTPASGGFTELKKRSTSVNKSWDLPSEISLRTDFGLTKMLTIIKTRKRNHMKQEGKKCLKSKGRRACSHEGCSARLETG